MAKQWSVVEFTEPTSVGSYDPTRNSLFGGIENVNGLVRAPLNRNIPYLEQPHSATLPTSVYADSNYIYTSNTMASGTTHRINRWDKNTLAWRGAIILTIPFATSEARITRDFWVNTASTEIIIGFTTTTAILGGLAWAYGIVDADWVGEGVLPAGTNIITPRVCFWLRSGVIDRVAAVGTGTNTTGYSTVSVAAETRVMANYAGGAQWTAGTNVFTGGSITGWAVSYNNGMWVAVGETTVTVAYSLDGIAWVNAPTGTALMTTRGRGVCYGEISGIGGRWVAVGIGTNSIIYSNDGLNWLASANGNAIFPAASGAMGICWDGTKFIAVGDGTSSSHTMATSTDGITWTGLGKAGAPNSPFTTTGLGIAYNGSQYVAVGTGGTSIAYSANGTTWTNSAATKFSATGNAICWGMANGTGYWVAAGVAGAVNHSLMYSTDGNNWTGAGVTMFPTIGNCVCWTGTMFVAGGTKGAGSFTAAYCGTFPPDTGNWVGVLTNLPQTAIYGIASAPAPNMYPPRVGANYNVFTTLVSLDPDSAATSVNNGTPGSFLLYLLQSTNNPASLITQQSPTYTQLDLGTLPTPQSGIITIPDSQRYSSGVLVGDCATYLPAPTLSQLVYATPGSNHVAGIASTPAIFLTRGTTTARLARIKAARFRAGTTISKRARTNNVATLTFASPHNFAVNQRVYIQGIGGSWATYYNGGNSGREPGTQVIITFTDSTHIQYVNAGPNEVETADTTGLVIPTITAEDDYMPDTPPLGATIQQAVQNFSGLSYDANNDYFLIVTNGSFRDYRTIFNPSGQMERFFGVIHFEANPIAANNLGLPSVFSSQLTVRQGFGGRTLVVARQGITAAAVTAQQLLLMEAGAQDGYVITKEILTPNATSFARVAVTRVRGGSGSYGSERIDLWFRTTGISDNSGAWIPVNDENTLVQVVAATSIQFKIGFDILNWTCISPQVSSLIVTWEDGTTTDSHYQPSAGKSSVVAKQFAWRFATAFGGTVPNLRVRLYDAVTGTLLTDDDTNTNPAAGTFEKSTNDGGGWSAWTNDDKGNDTTYLRYTPASTANNIRIKALLTLL